jgi:drug/metabolite transporter (DMT)-like permease
MHSKSHRSSVKCLTFLLVALIWGTTWTAIKLSLEGYPPVIGATLRFVFAIAMLGLYAGVTRLSLALPRTTTAWVVVTAILVYVIRYGLVYWGEQYLNAGVTAILFAVVPLATTFGCAFAFRTATFRHTVGGGVQRLDSTQRIDQFASRKWGGGHLCGTGDH